MKAEGNYEVLRFQPCVFQCSFIRRIHADSREMIRSEDLDCSARPSIGLTSVSSTNSFADRWINTTTGESGMLDTMSAYAVKRLQLSPSYERSAEPNEGGVSQSPADSSDDVVRLFFPVSWDENSDMWQDDYLSCRPSIGTGASGALRCLSLNPGSSNERT